MFDRSTHQEVARIDQRLLSMVPSYDISRNGQHWAHIHEKVLHLFGERFKIEGNNGMVFHVEGDIWNWNFSVLDSSGNLLGQISRRLSLFRDSYAVEVAQGVDVPFILTLTVVLEMVKEHHKK